MFPNDLREMISATTAKINPAIGDGLAVQHMKQAEKYIHDVWQVASAHFPEGLKYKGFRHPTPREEYDILTRKRLSDCLFDIARNDMYLLRYDFEWRGKPIRPRFIQLPFLGQAASLYIGGSRHYIAPVLTDRVISVMDSQVFIKLLKAKNIYKREQYYYKTNDLHRPTEFIQVVWSTIYNGVPEAGANRNRIKANTTIAHYLFCKFGVVETFQRFADCTPVLGQDEINEDNFPPDEWVICSTLGVRPKYVQAYAVTPMRIAVRKKDYSAMVKSLIAGYFYVIDRFAIRQAHVEHGSTTMWRVLLGILLSGSDSSEGKLIAEMHDHISSIDSYVDLIVAEQLRRIGYNCTNIYELFALVLKKYDDWMIENDTVRNSKYDKEISVLYYVCADITKQIFRLYFELNSSRRRELSESVIEGLMAKHIRTGAIYSLNKLHGEVHTQGTPGDNKILRPTQVLVPQSETSRLKANAGSGPDSTMNPANQFHMSFAEVHTLTGMSKAKPSGDTRINPFLELSPSGEVLRSGGYRELMDWAQRIITVRNRDNE
jgi:hypothetical protein